jgi:membrane protease YdiL (CAAX protease family)
MNRKGIILFYILTYSFAWGLSAITVIFPVWSAQHFGAVTLWNPLVFLVIWTPTIWAFVLAFALDGKAGLRDLFVRVFRWRVKLRWYLISTVGIAALALGARFAQAYVNHTPTPPVLDFSTWPVLIPYGLSMLVVDPGPIGEDPGWRGYALPRMLQRFSPTVAALLLGSVWAVWHLPAFLFSGMPQHPLSIGWFLLAVVALTFLMSWVAINTRGAVIPAILIHWTSNRFSLLEGQGAMYTAITYTLAAVLIVIATRGTLGFKKESGGVADFQTKL